MKKIFGDPPRLERILWALTLLTLPVTSFRWFPLLDEGTKVRPLALYPLVLLLLVLLIQWWRKRVILSWPGALTALAALILLIVAASAYGVLLDPIPLRGQVYLGRVLRALITLIIGAAFFVSSVWMNRDERDLRFSLTWIYAGLCLDLFWSALQAATFYAHALPKELVTHWQLTFSMRELVRSDRVSGLAYEPAWLAGQLATIYLPFLFAAVLTNYRLARWLEPALLAASAVVLLATYSRGGLLTAAVAATLTLLLFGRELLRDSWAWFIGGFRRGLVQRVARVGLIVVALASLCGVFLFLNSKDYFRRLWEINADTLSGYLVDINAGPRGAYLTSALAAYDAHPWTGVGLGASGFYMYQHLPDWAMTIVPEIAKQLSPDSHLYPNPKNLYVRLLAECGLIGFILFVAFQLHVLGDTLSFRLRAEPWTRFAATAGLFAWIAIALYNFTQDSLATPNMWIVPGILVGLASTLTSRAAA